VPEEDRDWIPQLWQNVIRIDGLNLDSDYHYSKRPTSGRLEPVIADCHRRPTLLGVPTVRHDGLVLFTEGQVVKIYARSAAEDRRVALALRRVSDNKPAPRLPAPDPRVSELQAEVCP
jgi:hypothetical protein